MTPAIEHYEKLERLIDELMAAYAEGLSSVDCQMGLEKYNVPALNYQSPQTLLTQIRARIRAKLDELYAVQMRTQRNRE